ncbi:hypothetical protein DFJ77DRAFT_472984 [Powellomyces hirtus]|nr:hypothetical protein DFJ77DRAFT_472984 [Powellomyces hirtus]
MSSQPPSLAPALPPREPTIKAQAPASSPVAGPAVPPREAAINTPTEVATGGSTGVSTGKKPSFASVTALTQRVTTSMQASAKNAQANLPTVKQVLEYHPLRLAYKAAIPYVINKDGQLGPDTPEARKRNLDRVHFVSTWLDAKYSIPFTNYKIGIDPLISAVPVVGDVISTTMSCYVVYLARRFHVPWYVTAKMVWNVLLNATFGSVPIVGSAFDVAYKPNLRNLILLEEFLKKEAVKLGNDPKIIDQALAQSRQDLWPDHIQATDGDKDRAPVWPDHEVAKEGIVPLTR